MVCICLYIFTRFGEEISYLNIGVASAYSKHSSSRSEACVVSMYWMDL